MKYLTQNDTELKTLGRFYVVLNRSLLIFLHSYKFAMKTSVLINRFWVDSRYPFQFASSLNVISRQMFAPFFIRRHLGTMFSVIGTMSLVLSHPRRYLFKKYSEIFFVTSDVMLTIESETPRRLTAVCSGVPPPPPRGDRSASACRSSPDQLLYSSQSGGP